MKPLAAVLAMLILAGCMQVTRERADEELIRTHPGMRGREAKASGSP